MLRPTAAILPLILAGVASVAGAADEDENRKRLEAMPREQRLHLSRTLDRFDSLPSSERSAVRDLDAALSKLDPDVRARYRLLLRRYHVWLGGLDDDQGKQLAAAGSVDAKLALAAKWRRAEREADTKTRRNLVMGVHPGDLGAIPPFEMANALRVWSNLNASERANIEKFKNINRRMIELARIGRERGIVPVRFPKATEDVLIQELESHEMAKAIQQRWAVKQEKAGDPTAARKAQDSIRWNGPLHPLAESLYFMKHPPPPVSTDNLSRFDAEIPEWLRATLDPLPPDDARRRLTILYRQIYPPGEEIPTPLKKGPDKAEDAPKSKTPAPKPAPAAPF